ncbi:hypothetical protein EDB84DRAFT_1441903 [Lactarius hengduanensis]|nr:hypothetical protein EDB84DRAFT_1441903 [Lactarius hengduanensis]
MGQRTCRGVADRYQLPYWVMAAQSHEADRHRCFEELGVAIVALTAGVVSSPSHRRDAAQSQNQRHHGGHNENTPPNALQLSGTVRCPNAVCGGDGITKCHAASLTSGWSDSVTGEDGERLE